MSKFKQLLVVAAFAASTAGAFAQGSNVSSYGFYPHGFVGIQGGGHWLISDHATENVVTKPFVGVQVGSWFIPQLGVRLSIQGYQNKLRISNNTLPLNILNLQNLQNIEDLQSQKQSNVKSTYSFKSITTDIDLMLSLSNLFCPNRLSQRWNVFLVAGFGFGVNTIWDIEFEGDKFNRNYIELSKDIDEYWSNVRSGAGVEYNFSKRLGLNFEVDYNWKNDKPLSYDVNKTMLYDITAAIGLNVRFGNGRGSKKYEQEASPLTTQAEYEAQAAATAAAAEAAARKAEAEAARARALEAQRKAEATALEKAKAEEEAKWAHLGDVNFEYDIRGVEPKNGDVLDHVVEWAKRHADKHVIVNGYADRGTGNPRINMKYSEMRARKVADALKAAGVPADQIIVKAWGDKVQPYKENDKNRCVIVLEQ